MKKGFTLAEVLITLGIIGVVAAMTMPVLIANYNKKAWVTQLQKTYSTLEQGLQLMLADEGVSKLTDLSYWPPSGSCNGLTWETKDACKNLLSNFKKYFKSVGFEDYGLDAHHLTGTRTESPTDRKVFILPDGAMVALQMSTYETTPEVCNTTRSLGGTMCSYALRLNFVDINGRKGPNKFGRDIFQVIVSNEGKLYPNYGKDFALMGSRKSLDNNKNYWRNNPSTCGTPDSSELPDNAYGYSCAARIIENGWVMDY